MNSGRCQSTIRYAVIVAIGTPRCSRSAERGKDVAPEQLQGGELGRVVTPVPEPRPRAEVHQLEVLAANHIACVRDRRDAVVRIAGDRASRRDSGETLALARTFGEIGKARALTAVVLE